MKPPYSGDNQAMLRWLELRLEEKLRESITEKLNEFAAIRKAPSKPLTREHAVLWAQRGDVEPLRRYLVENGESDIAPFIARPKSERGKQWNPARTKRKKQPPEIAEWARIIRKIWEENYDTKKRRAPDWTAEEFAFALYMMDAGVEGFDPTVPEPHPDDPQILRWTDRATDQNKHGKK